MPGNFMSPDGDLETMFVVDYAMIDEYAKTGSLWLWGRGGEGQLGDNATLSRSSPVQTISTGTNWKQISMGGDQGCVAAIKTDGTLWMWGPNSNGRLGDTTIVAKSSPVQTIAGGTNWKQVSSGLSTAAIKTDGTLWTWGSNFDGVLGDGTILSKSSPVQTISGGTNWKQVTTGVRCGAAIKTDGTLWIWGWGPQGQLGDGTVLAKSSPVQTISGGTNWKQVSGGGSCSAAIKTDGTLWMWGFNGDGALGDNTITNTSSPVQTIAGGTNWKQVVTCYTFSGHSAAIKTDGTLWLWGANTSGALGDNTIVKKSSPVQTIAGGTNWKQVSVSAGSTAAIKTDGTLWTWGSGTMGTSGDNTNTNKSSPVQTISGGTNWKQLSCGGANPTVGAIYFYDANNLYPSN